MSGPAVAWYYRYGSLCAEAHDTVEGAIEALWHGEEFGELSTVGIETADSFDPEPRKHPYWEQLAEEDEEQYAAAMATEPPKMKHISGPGPYARRTATVHAVDADAIAAILGHDRIRTP